MCGYEDRGCLVLSEVARRLPDHRGNPLHLLLHHARVVVLDHHCVVVVRHNLLAELVIVDRAIPILVEGLHQPSDGVVRQVEVVGLQEAPELRHRDLTVALGIHGFEEPAQRGEAGAELGVDLVTEQRDKVGGDAVDEAGAVVEHHNLCKINLSQISLESYCSGIASVLTTGLSGHRVVP